MPALRKSGEKKGKAGERGHGLPKIRAAMLGTKKIRTKKTSTEESAPVRSWTDTWLVFFKCVPGIFF
jgi:hypothetical protein